MAADHLGEEEALGERLSIRHRANLLYALGDYAEAQREADDFLSLALAKRASADFAGGSSSRGDG